MRILKKQYLEINHWKAKLRRKGGLTMERTWQEINKEKCLKASLCDMSGWYELD